MRRHIILILFCGLSVIVFAQSSTYSYIMSRTKMDTGTNAWLDHIDYDNGLVTTVSVTCTSRWT